MEGCGWAQRQWEKKQRKRRKQRGSEEGKESKGKEESKHYGKVEKTEGGLGI